MEKDNGWKDILLEQPAQGERVLVKIIGGMVRMTDYDKFKWEHWCVTQWKSIPRTGSNA